MQGLVDILSPTCHTGALGHFIDGSDMFGHVLDMDKYSFKPLSTCVLDLHVCMLETYIAHLARAAVAENVCASQARNSTEAVLLSARTTEAHNSSPYSLTTAATLLQPLTGI